jgi:hypothetical protein
MGECVLTRRSMSKTPEVINLSTDASGTTATSSVLTVAKQVVGVTIGLGHNTRNGTSTLTMTVSGSTDEGTTWTVLGTISNSLGTNTKGYKTNYFAGSTVKYNRFKLVSNIVDTYWEFVYYGHASVTVI